MQQRIANLRKYFDTAKIHQRLKIGSWWCDDVPKMVRVHLKYLSSGNDKFRRPYLERLEEVKSIIEQQNKTK